MFSERFLLMLLSRARNSKLGVLFVVLGVLVLFAILILGLVSLLGDISFMVNELGPILDFLNTGAGILIGFFVAALLILLGVGFLVYSAPQSQGQILIVNQDDLENLLETKLQQKEEERVKLQAEKDTLEKELEEARTNASEQRIHGEQPDDEGLKQRCCELSDGLFVFLNEREQETPQDAMRLSDIWSKDPESKKRFEETTRHNKETMDQYREQYGSDVIALFDDLEQRGWVNPKDRARFENPMILQNIQYIAQRLGAICRKKS